MGLVPSLSLLMIFTVLAFTLVYLTETKEDSPEFQASRPRHCYLPESALA